MCNKIYRFFLGLMAMLPLAAQAQNSSLNTFSPFTYYGIGDILPVGTTTTRSMGGIGVAYWNPYEVNLVNPAAYSVVSRQSAVFTIGLAGKSSYLETDKTKTANNGFSFNDLGFMIPLGKHVGFAVTVMPYSSVGYHTMVEETDPELITEVGNIFYDYTGEGNISQLKAGIGMQLFKGFSLGADFIAYMGSISRYSSTQISPVGTESYLNTTTLSREEVLDVSFGLGMQYDLIRQRTRVLTLGATYQPNTNLKNKHIRHTYRGGDPADTVSFASVRREMTIPQKIAGGIYYRTLKLGIGADYSYQDWNGAFTPEESHVSLTKTQSVNFGLQYTPDAGDIRRMLNRWTYRAGFRYTENYMVIDGFSTNDMGITLGLGIPFRAGSFSEINLGFEVGQRGSLGVTPNHIPKVRDRYFRVSLGFSLFDNNWFVKYKYN